MHMLAILSKALVIPGLVSNHGHVSLMATGTPWKRPLTMALALMYDMIMSNQAEEYVWIRGRPCLPSFCSGGACQAALPGRRPTSTQISRMQSTAKGGAGK